MSHWAEIDSNNKVIRVLVCDNEDPNGDEGYKWLMDNFGGKWLKTSFNGNIRKNYAGPGFTYDEELDAFISPSPFPSFYLDKETCKWTPPIPYPSDPDSYFWDEPTLSWIKLDTQEGSN